MRPFGLSRARPPRTGQADAPAAPAAYWSLASANLLSLLRSTGAGLSVSDAEQRLEQCGRNAIQTQGQPTGLGLFLTQFTSPLVLILVVAALISAFVGEWADASIVLAVIIGSTTLGFVQEYRASNAVAKL